MGGELARTAQLETGLRRLAAALRADGEELRDVIPAGLTAVSGVDLARSRELLSAADAITELLTAYALHDPPRPEPGMSIETALIRAGYILGRYAGCDSTVLRVITAADVDAIAVLARAARDLLASGPQP